jgi:hypothetical protein
MQLCTGNQTCILKEANTIEITHTGIHMQLIRTAAAKTDVHKHGKKYGNLKSFHQN